MEELYQRWLVCRSKKEWGSAFLVLQEARRLKDPEKFHWIKNALCPQGLFENGRWKFVGYYFERGPVPRKLVRPMLTASVILKGMDNRGLVEPCIRSFGSEAIEILNEIKKKSEISR